MARSRISFLVLGLLLVVGCVQAPVEVTVVVTATPTSAEAMSPDEMDHEFLLSALDCNDLLVAWGHVMGEAESNPGSACGVWREQYERAAGAFERCWVGVPEPDNRYLKQADAYMSEAIDAGQESVGEFGRFCDGAGGDLEVALSESQRCTRALKSGVESLGKYEP